jgi:4-hydroxy-3-polyprenylbenzoate decarboxylase
MTPKRIIIGISGATGTIYGIELLKELRELGVETHLVISKNGQIAIAHETDYSVADVQKLADHFYSNSDLSAAISSGSFKTTGMIVAPCSMRSLAEIATANTSTLLTRAADVVLKERRRLVVLPRETPLTLAHIRNMATVTEMGGIIAPPLPAFYAKPASIQDIVDHTVARVLDLFDIETTKIKRWEGVS